MDWEHLHFRYWSPSVNFCNGDVSADAPVKGTIQTLTIYNGQTCRDDALLYSAAPNMLNFISQSICL